MSLPKKITYLKLEKLYESDLDAIGKVEPYFDELPDGFRSIVVSRLNKIVYRILEDCIEISDFWNCRRNPETLVSNIKTQ